MRAWFLYCGICIRLGGCRAICIFLLSVAGCAIAVAQPSSLADSEGNLILFPTRNDLYELKDTNGTPITVRIIRVDPRTAEITAFIPATEQTSRFPLSLLDEQSKRMVEEWFIKDELRQHLRIATEEIEDGRSYTDYKGPLLQPYHSGNTSSISSIVRERRILAEIFNGTDLNVEGVDVLLGVRVERRASDSGSSLSGFRSGFYAGARKEGIVLAPRQKLFAESAVVPLLNYNESYTITTESLVRSSHGWRPRTVVNRYRLRVTDRISNHYVVVLYKGEPVALFAPRTNLNGQIIQHITDFRNGQPDGTDLIAF